MILPKLAASIRQRFAPTASDVGVSQRIVLSTDLPGPPAVAIARRLSKSRSDVEIASLETEFKMRGRDLAVRAWFVVGAEHLSSDLRANLPRAIAALGATDSLMSRVFYLSTSYRIPTARIAGLLGLRRRRVRRLLIEAIAALDRLER
jgi:RNA polymerase sigma-70 factor (ECF subfamily)